MKIIFEGKCNGDNWGEFKTLWPTDEYRFESAIKLLEKRIIRVPTSLEEARHNQSIHSEITKTKNEQNRTL